MSRLSIRTRPRRSGAAVFAFALVLSLIPGDDPGQRTVPCAPGLCRAGSAGSGAPAALAGMQAPAGLPAALAGFPDAGAWWTRVSQTIGSRALPSILEHPVWEYHGDCQHAYLGAMVCALGDVQGDGFSEMAVTEPSYEAGPGTYGRVLIFSGDSYGFGFDPHWTLNNSVPGDGAFRFVAPAGDVNGDGHADLVMACATYPNEDGNLGRVWVYYGENTGFGDTPTILQSVSADSTGFGASATGVGDVNGDGYDDVMFGATYYTGDQFKEGRAWIYPGSASGLGTSPIWQTEGNQAECRYGWCAPAGDVNGDGFADVLVGAARFDTPAVDAGRVYLYLGGAGGPSTIPAATLDGEGAGGHYGTSLNRAGDVNGDGYGDIIVGAPDWVVGPNEGRAYLYPGNASGISTTPLWQHDGYPDASYGLSVGTVGDVNGDGFSDIAVSAPYYTGDLYKNGRVCVHYGSRTGPTAEPDWTADGHQAVGGFGFRVGSTGDCDGDGFGDFYISEQNLDSDYENEGAVWVYYGSGDGPKTSPGWAGESNQAEACFGNAVARAGDVNGDGYEDVLVSAPFYDNGETDEGAVFLFCGRDYGLEALPSWWAESNQAYAQFGRSVACAGDVNDDGYDDVLVGAPYYDAGSTNEGAAFLWLGTGGTAPYGNPGNAAWTARGGQAEAAFGWSVGGAGDVNGDGYGDVIVGAPKYSHGEIREGGAFVYLGSATGLSASSAWSGEGQDAEEFYGNAVAGAGDVNGDGFSDILVGAPFSDDTAADEGSVWLYPGTSAGPSTYYGWWAYGLQAGAHFGQSVAAAGDVNGDGYGDLLVGAPDYDNGTFWEPSGAAFAWYGAALGPSGHDPAHCDQPIPVVYWEGAQSGFSLAGGGDVNGDGYSDVLIGVPRYLNGELVRAGSIFWVPGSWNGLETYDGVLIQGAQAEALFGTTVGMADVNGDGFSDLLTGAPLHDQGQTNEGRGFVYYGNGGRGLARAADQRQWSGAPVALLGTPHATSSFSLSVLGRTAAGRGKIRLEWEVKPLGTLFDGDDIVRETYSDPGAPGSGGCLLALTVPVTGLTAQTGYHWRLRVGSPDPLFPATPWLSPGGNGPQELDLRTSGAAASVAARDVKSPALEIRPNPLRERTSLRFTLPASAHVRVSLYNVTGREVIKVLDGPLAAGAHVVSWDGRGRDGRRVAPGVYWAVLSAEGREVRGRIVVAD